LDVGKGNGGLPFRSSVAKLLELLAGCEFGVLLGSVVSILDIFAIVIICISLALAIGLVVRLFLLWGLLPPSCLVSTRETLKV
jgi:hypothetical protein